MKKHICVITGSRSDYGLLYWTMKEINNDKKLKLTLIVTGMHLSKKFGETYKKLISDGFDINYKVHMNLSKDNQIAISYATGNSIGKFATIYKSILPDTVLLLGDRYEIFSAAIAALITNIPITHLHGGESTAGAIDDSIRHAITKMSTLHFATTHIYMKRIIRMGENKNNVYNVGSPGVEFIKRAKLLQLNELESKLKFRFNKYNLLISFHSTTREENTSKKYFSNILTVITKLKETNIIFTKTNSDYDGKIINNMIDEYVGKNKKNCISFKSMGQINYLSAMRLVDGIIGNSSSAIIEAPSLNCGVVNIGNRQAGRIRAKNVIDCKNSVSSIHSAIKKLYSKKYVSSLKKIKNPYEKKHTSKKIIKAIKSFNFKKSNLKKFEES